MGAGKGEVSKNVLLLGRICGIVMEISMIRSWKAGKGVNEDVN